MRSYESKTIKRSDMGIQLSTHLVSTQSGEALPRVGVACAGQPAPSPSLGLPAKPPIRRAEDV
jgi:hypothetical protein